MKPAYREDLAHIHDAGFTDFARKAGAGILEIFRERGIVNGRVVDLGCGSGVWARMLVDAGYDAYGIDISEAMVALARARVPEARFEVGSLLEAGLPSCRAVTSMGECLNYLFDERNDLSALRRLFTRVYEALEPGGVFIFDVIGPGYASISGPPKRHFLTEDWAVLTEVRENPEDETMTRSITTFRKTNGLYSRDEEVHRVKLYQGIDLEHTLLSAGFEVQLSQAYPGFPLTGAHSVLVATRLQT